MNGKELLLQYDRDDSRMAEYLAELITDKNSLLKTIKKCQEKLELIEPEIKKTEKMSLSKWVSLHPDENYKGVFKGKKAGSELLN